MSHRVKACYALSLVGAWSFHVAVQPGRVVAATRFMNAQDHSAKDRRWRGSRLSGSESLSWST